MGASVVVDRANFETDVVEKSYEKIVLIDFFAQWCGPCQMLKPVLEKLVNEYDFVLAKIDIDQNPELANTYGVEGVPDVRIMSQGEMFQGFVGVLPEAQLRDLLTQLGLRSELEKGMEAIQVAKTAGDVGAVKRLFDGLIERYPDNRPLILEAVRFLMSQNLLEPAEKLLGLIQEGERKFYAEAQALKTLIQFQRESSNPTVEDEWDALYLKATRQTLDGNYEEALQNFLEIVSRNRKYRDDGARKSMVAIFDLLGDDHPLTRHFRKQLTLTLY